MNDRLKALADAGVSIWLDDLSRERLETGNLSELMKDKHVVGVTTNPTIFASALAEGERYDAQLRELARGHSDTTDKLVEDTVFALTTTDVRDACDLFTDTFESTGGRDGRVSIEVSPDLAHDTGGTLHMAKELWRAVDRPNCLIKIPATTEGLPAITGALAEGISVNVTLIFGLDRYRDVMEAYVSGLEQAAANGHDLANIHSVASFFVSRVDTEVDKRLDGIDEDVTAVRGRVGVANARLAFQAFERFFAGDRWDRLAAQGAHVQRPLWASTGVKNPDYRDTMYVDDLVVEGVVNTMPEKTLDAVADHGDIDGDQVHDHYSDAADVIKAMEGLGIPYDDVIATLEKEGVEKFVDSWHELLDTVRGQLEAALADVKEQRDADRAEGED
jgi:transaldolase